MLRPIKTVKNITYKYFVTYESEGKFHAYPVEIKDKKLLEEMKKNISQPVRLKGEIKTVKVAIDGPAKEIPVFVPESISPLTLSELSVEFKPDLEKRPSDLNSKEPYSGGGIRINDTLANTLIITTGALMVGSALYRSLHKK